MQGKSCLDQNWLYYIYNAFDDNTYYDEDGDDDDDDRGAERVAETGRINLQESAPVSPLFDHTMPCNSMQCHTTHAMQCNAAQWNVMQESVNLSFFVRPYNAMQCHVIQFHDMQNIQCNSMQVSVNLSLLCS